MAARALAAVAGCRIAGQTGAPLIASCRRGAQNHSSSAQPEEQNAARDDRAAATITALQVEAALNRKNVEVLHEERTATVLQDETVDALEGEAGDDAWVPNQETGVFVPADKAADTDNVNRGTPTGPPHSPGTAAGGSASVLDQTVFVREEDMEDVERPAIDMANANDNAK